MCTRPQVITPTRPPGRGYAPFRSARVFSHSLRLARCACAAVRASRRRYHSGAALGAYFYIFGGAHCHGVACAAHPPPLDGCGSAARTDRERAPPLRRLVQVQERHVEVQHSAACLGGDDGHSARQPEAQHQVAPMAPCARALPFPTTADARACPCRVFGAVLPRAQPSPLTRTDGTGATVALALVLSFLRTDAHESTPAGTGSP